LPPTLLISLPGWSSLWPAGIRTSAVCPFSLHANPLASDTSVTYLWHMATNNAGSQT
jgi:hypothetical protein